MGIGLVIAGAGPEAGLRPASTGVCYEGDSSSDATVCSGSTGVWEEGDSSSDATSEESPTHLLFIFFNSSGVSPSNSNAI